MVGISKSWSTPQPRSSKSTVRCWSLTRAVVAAPGAHVQPPLGRVGAQLAATHEAAPHGQHLPAAAQRLEGVLEGEVADRQRRAVRAPPVVPETKPTTKFTTFIPERNGGLMWIKLY